MNATNRKNGKGTRVAEAAVKYDVEGNVMPPETTEAKAPEGAEQTEPKANGKLGKGKGKAGKAAETPKGNGNGNGKGKMNLIEAKPIPESIKRIAEQVGKLTDLEELKGVARVVQRTWKKVYLDACKKATAGMKEKDLVWFKKGSKVIVGTFLKVKSNGKAKIDVDGKTWRVPGALVHKGKVPAQKNGGAEQRKAA